MTNENDDDDDDDDDDDYRLPTSDLAQVTLLR
jgi:hypothetical protein